MYRSVDGTAQTTQLTESLTEGENTITRSFTDAAGNTGTSSILVTLDTQAPVVTITSPANGMITNQFSVSVVWSVDGVAQTTQLTESLTEGDNTIIRSFTDAAGNTGTVSIHVTLDTQVPIVAITSPAEGKITNQSEIAVAWSVDGVAQTTQLIASLTEGDNTITRSFTDTAGNTGTTIIHVTLDTYSPVILITSPAENAHVTESTIAVIWSVDGILQNQQNTENLIIGLNRIIRSATDNAGNTGIDTVVIYRDDACISITNTTLTIGRDNTSYDGRSLCVNNSTLNIYGFHNFRDITLNHSTMIADTCFNTNNLILTNTSVLTHPETNTDTVYGLRISATTVNVDATSSVNVDGRGYVGDRYINAGWRGARTTGNVKSNISGNNNNRVCGGTHGGLGGWGGDVTYSRSPLPPYDDAFAPSIPGSGGGADTTRTDNFGGDGGGLIDIIAKKVIINGVITANGAAASTIPYSYVGCGAGGSIRIQADSVSGVGRVEAKGGASSNSTNYTGGGGRICINAHDSFGMSMSSISTIGNTYTSSQPGRNGSSVVITGSEGQIRKVYVSNPSRTAGYSISAVLNEPKYGGADIFVRNSGLKINGSHIFKDITIVSSEVEFDGMVRPSSMVLDSSSNLTVSHGLVLETLSVRASSRLITGGDLEIKNFNVLTNSVISHKKTAVDTVYRLKIISTNVFIDSTSSIDVSGLGYVGDRNVNSAWRNARTYGNIETFISSNTHTYVCAGSHGGVGGTYSGIPNSAYGNKLFPMTHGGGGGANRSSTSYFGGDGGGVVFIETNYLGLNGAIKSNGQSVATMSGGGGAGGSIFIFAESLEGKGILEAKGGTGLSTGGGGRIALYNCSGQGTISPNVSGYNTGTTYTPCNSNTVQIVKPLPNEYLNISPTFVYWYSNGVLHKDTGLLSEGWNTIVRTDTILGVVHSDSVDVLYDTIPPNVKIVQPSTDTVFTNQNTITVQWEVDGQAKPSIIKNLISGINVIECKAIDSAGNAASDYLYVISDHLTYGIF